MPWHTRSRREDGNVNISELEIYSHGSRVRNVYGREFETFPSV